MIDPDVSDLFFNYDVSEAETYVEGKGGRAFSGYDHDKLLATADTFCGSLARAGGPTVDPGELVDDFLSRV